MAFATKNDVANLTGHNVGESDVVMAQGIIELMSGRTEEVTGSLKARDRYWLKMATIYQVAWMQSHPEMFSTMDVDSLQQLDLRIQFREDRDAAVVAPLARKALKRLSWTGTRSIPVGSAFQRAPTDDHEGLWEPM